MLSQKMFRAAFSLCLAAAAALPLPGQESRTSGLLGTVKAGVYFSPTGAYSIEIPVLPDLGGAIKDTPNVATFQDSYGLQVSVAAFAHDATQKWELSTRGTKDYLIYFLGSIVLPDFRQVSPKTSVESASFQPDLMDGAVFAYILMPGGSMFELQDAFARPSTPPVAKRGNLLFVKNGFTFVVSSELSERVTEGSSYKKTPAEEDQILRARLVGIVKKMQFPAPATPKLAAPNGTRDTP